MSSIGLGARSPIIGAHADHRTTDFFFPRTQSLQTRNLPWERRMKPLLSVQHAALQVFVVLTVAIVTFSIV
jgi:hypothetical protein